VRRRRLDGHLRSAAAARRSLPRSRWPRTTTR
jgi:hypothetical protein